MDEFYLTLISNSSMDKFNNTKSNYTTLLSNTIQLNGKYEIGLVNFSCTSNINYNLGTIKIYLDNHYQFAIDRVPSLEIPLNISLTDNYKAIFYQINEIISEYMLHSQLLINGFLFYQNFSNINRRNLEQFETAFAKDDQILPIFHVIDDEDNTDYYIPCRFNTTLLKLLQDVKKSTFNNYIIINKENTERLATLFKLRFYPLSQYITVKSFDDLANKMKTSNFALNKSKHENYNTAEIYFDIDLKNRIKINYANWFKELPSIYCSGVIQELIFKKSYIPLGQFYDLPATLDLLKYICVYTDIIEPQYTGDTVAQIIDIIPFEINYKGSIFTYNANNIHYVPVKQNFLNTINISIRDLIGNLIKFSDDFVYTVSKFHIKKR